MSKEELIKKLEESCDKWLIDENFGGSPSEAEYANGKADAYSDALGWVKRYFEAVQS